MREGHVSRKTYVKSFEERLLSVIIISGLLTFVKLSSFFYFCVKTTM